MSEVKEITIQEIVKAIKRKGKGLWVPVGYSREGLELINLANDNSCHILQGGSTGGGKSTLMKLIMVILHLVYTSKDVVLWILDMKHGNEMKMLGKNPSLAVNRCDSPDKAESFLRQLWAEVQRRYVLLNELDATGLDEYNEIAEEKLPRIFLVIDEFGKLEGKDYDKARLLVKHITGDGRAAGVHVYLSAHRPVATLVDGTLKNNFPVVIAFRSNPISARVLLGEDDWKMAKRIDPEISGRALLSHTHQVLIQVPFLSNPYAKKLMAKYQRPIVQKVTKSPL